jgi:hypothetical protein
VVRAVWAAAWMSEEARQTLEELRAEHRAKQVESS